MENQIVYQDYKTYLSEDHGTWGLLIDRHKALCSQKISKEYLEGYLKLNLDENQIVNLESISAKLESLSGWSLVGVNGLIPTKDFFYMLINKKYPVTISIRKPHELEFSEQPDIFHDICGHIPMLTNEKFIKFLTAYCTIALKYANNDRAISLLGRLYWFTYEMGIILEDGERKPYGGAIITSSEEILNMNDVNIPKHAFDIDLIFATEFSPYSLQKEYFVINSFDELFNCLDTLEMKLIEHLSLPYADCMLRNYSLNKNIGINFNNVIGFLNDVQYKFPNAISFVAGQPDEDFFEIESNISKFEVYVTHLMSRTGRSRKSVVNGIGQYNKTKGIISDVIVEYLKNDENIVLNTEDILITVGAQEAFSIIISTICNRSNDVILVEDPSYIGVSSFAKVFDYNIAGIKIDDDGIDLKELRSKLIELNGQGKQVKLVYVIPDYQNPSGTCMPIGNRLLLLEMAQQYNFLIIEDSVYNSFTYAQKKNPTLKSLDLNNRVIYVGSFSKSLFPGLRLGIIGANQKIENELGITVALSDELAKVKAQLTNNTSTINQAILGGVLLDLNCSLNEWSKPKFESYKRKRDHMIKSLNKYIRAYKNDWASEVNWNEPDGGFFIKMTVPFLINNESVYESASNFNVIFCPMRNFYLKSGGENDLRLTFSNLSLDDIDKGVEKLASFLKSRIMLNNELLNVENHLN
ncbi:phenylalanine-4-hydroxylase, monomeric form [Pedobacter steynii]|uniref:Phenylalanine-4-hydroxylase, monomeric form n=1 Tax=Pedobacter steynii TaxID=430522 RepID=A0A1G9VA55_9SPHI|nr:aminotransferase class I/II-fold pyridoxal phosphate-dependent enzyme [Pedobacter steynii]NQX41021.1 aminotransferase class I/II-fold pyridoxal phosphate-dependent enzyme [Pedobacter steynii]SDM68755.1 phenylalanine-4-hydroxylase, monomeric form [Pedobacter steynii]